MFEVGKLCEESLDSFLSELEKVSLLDAEGEGEVSRYFAHAVNTLCFLIFAENMTEGDMSCRASFPFPFFSLQVILRSTITALRNVTEAGIDLLRLECLEMLEPKTRDRLLEKKYK